MFVTHQFSHGNQTLHDNVKECHSCVAFFSSFNSAFKINRPFQSKPVLDPSGKESPGVYNIITVQQ